MEKENEEIPSHWEVFEISGPFHLTSIDWGISDHKRSIATSLIKGVYVMGEDRKSSLAPKWWEFFHFQCIQTITDPIDQSIFGVIFAYKPSLSNPSSPPSYVIAFRGTLNKSNTRKRDFYLDAQLPLKGLPYDSRYHKAFEAVNLLTSQVGSQSIWLAGHSLGAAIALQVGKDMAKRGTYIETFLFNPPYTSGPIEMINNPMLKTRIRVARSLLIAGLSAAFKGSNNDDYISTPKNDPFTKLCSWVPHLFVNPRDPICCEYIGYFEHRQKMEKIGMGKIENIATKNSVMNMFSSSAFGRDGEPTHLVPSALLIKNMTNSVENVMVAHGIHQWWQPNSWTSKLHIFSKCNCQ